MAFVPWEQIAITITISVFSKNQGYLSWCKCKAQNQDDGKFALWRKLRGCLSPRRASARKMRWDSCPGIDPGEETVTANYLPEALSSGLITFTMESHQSKPRPFAHQSFHLLLFYCLSSPFHNFSVFSNLLPQIHLLTQLTYKARRCCPSLTFLH